MGKKKDEGMRRAYAEAKAESRRKFLIKLGLVAGGGALASLAYFFSSGSSKTGNTNPAVSAVEPATANAPFIETGRGYSRDELFEIAKKRNMRIAYPLKFWTSLPMTIYNKTPPGLMAEYTSITDRKVCELALTSFAEKAFPSDVGEPKSLEFRILSCECKTGFLDAKPKAFEQVEKKLNEMIEFSRVHLNNPKVPLCPVRFRIAKSTDELKNPKIQESGMSIMYITRDDQLVFKIGTEIVCERGKINSDTTASFFRRGGQTYNIDYRIDRDVDGSEKLVYSYLIKALVHIWELEKKEFHGEMGFIDSLFSEVFHRATTYDSFQRFLKSIVARRGEINRTNVKGKILDACAENSPLDEAFVHGMSHHLTERYARFSGESYEVRIDYDSQIRQEYPGAIRVMELCRQIGAQNVLKMYRDEPDKLERRIFGK
jgi:hypothetical protein